MVIKKKKNFQSIKIPLPNRKQEQKIPINIEKYKKINKFEMLF
jgi:hypothetical protein